MYMFQIWSLPNDSWACSIPSNLNESTYILLIYVNLKIYIVCFDIRF